MLPLENPLIQCALTHSSYVKENPDAGSNNEILEFIGDAVLQLCVTDLLVELFPEMTEGDLTRVRHQLVDTVTLASIARDLQLGSMIRLGLGEEQTGGRDRNRMLANVFEAILGALYRHFDLETCKEVINKQFKQRAMDVQTFVPPKQFLMEWCQKKYQDTPVYKEIERKGPSHSLTFTIGVWINGQLVAQGDGKSKKSAQMSAASNAVVVLGLSDANSDKIG